MWRGEKVEKNKRKLEIKPGELTSNQEEFQKKTPEKTEKKKLSKKWNRKISLLWRLRVSRLKGVTNYPDQQMQKGPHQGTLPWNSEKQIKREKTNQNPTMEFKWLE